MTTFKITNDDTAVRGLQESNKSPVVTGPVQPVKASKPVQKSADNIAIQRLNVERKNHPSAHPRRRHADRRKTDIPVILDTRSSHDRRISSDHSDDAGHTLHGIDETV